MEAELFDSAEFLSSEVALIAGLSHMALGR